MRTRTNVLGRIRMTKPASVQALSEEILQRGVRIISQYGKYWVSAGTALGFVRDHGFIPHDTDIDVEMPVMDSLTLGNLARDMLVNGFYLVLSQIRDDNVTTQLAFEDQKTGVVFDIYFYSIKDNNYINYNEHGTLTIPKDMIDNMDTVEVFNSVYTIPGPKEDYLELRYGKDWRIPKKEKENWSKDAANLS